MSDGRISIKIEVDGKEVNVASKELDKLEESGVKSGKGIKAAEDSMDNLADKSAKAGSSVKGASDAIDDLGDSGSKAGKDLKGADGAIDSLSDSSSEASKNVKGVSDSLDGVSDTAGDAASELNKAKNETEKVGQETEKASNNTKKFAVSIGLIAIAATAFGVLKSALDDAISRFDTLNQFPKVLQALGVSAEDSERAITRLSDGIDGLPTKLDEIASLAQRMYTSFSDMDKATDSALALNNALLGSGASAGQATRGTEQYLKSLQTGKMYLSTWNTLQETMDVGLIKIAESFGYTGKSAKDDLYRALQSGTHTLDEFNDKLIEVGTGTGIMATLARENSLGIATSLQNLKSAASRGVANMIDSFNKLSKEVTGKEIAQNLDSLKVIVNQSFKVMGKAIEGSAPIIKAFGSAVSATIPVVKTLSPAIIGLMSAYAAHTVITKASAVIQASNASLKIAMSSTQALTLVTKAKMAAQVASTTATQADIVATAAQTGAVKLSTLAIGVMTGTIKLSTAAKVIGTAASYAFGAAIRFLLGPIGWVVAGIGLLVTGIIAVVKWFKRTTAEAERLNKETEDLGDSVDSLNDSVKNSADAYKKNQSEIKASAKANEALVKKIDELAKKENKSATDKRLLKSYIDELNGSVEGLNLTYNDEANALNMSSDKLKARIGLMKEQETAQEAQSRLTEILKEQAEVEEKLKETNALREEWNQKLDEGSVKSGEHKKALEELDEQEQALKETTSQLAVEQKNTEEQMTASIEAITEATKNGVYNQIIAYEDLSEAQQKTIDDMKSTWEDYKDAATDMFDRLSEKSKLSIADMQKNLEENQRIITSWSENIAKLAERGVDEGLLETLRAAGPESAGHVNALVNASDTELQKLSDAFAKGGDVATKALSKSLGIEESGVMEAVGSLVTDAEQSLKEKIESADFKSIGGSVPEGLSEGIKSGSKNAEDASKKMADDTTKAAKDALQTKSPSRVFKGIGTDVADGLALGISQGSRKVVQAVQRMFKSVQSDSTSSFRMIIRDFDGAIRIIETTLSRLPEVTHIAMRNMLNRLRTEAGNQVNFMKKHSNDLLSPFNNLNSQFRAVGLNAMAGLNQGLNTGGARAIATARRVANEITRTMKSALKIHSPSKLMRDEIGKMIPAGIALGIKENAQSVYDALNILNGNMMVATPEVALGTSRMVYSSGSQLANVSSSNSVNAIVGISQSGSQAIKIEPSDVIMDGRKVGQVQWRYVKENIDRDDRTTRKFRG